MDVYLVRDKQDTSLSGRNMGSNPLHTTADIYTFLFYIKIKKYLMSKNKIKYHFLYKTTNLINNKYYYGMHSTYKLDDGYLGSGNRLRYSIRKYGKEILYLIL